LNGVPEWNTWPDAGNDGEASIQVVFNLGTDPNQAAINVQNRVASVVNKLPPLVVREGWKLLEKFHVDVNPLVRIKNTDQKFLYNYADINVLSELKRVNGVGSGDILGTREICVFGWNLIAC
jgi:HAE1 family hydrophobic/amphiphilic exporter-1